MRLDRRALIGAAAALAGGLGLTGLLTRRNPVGGTMGGADLARGHRLRDGSFPAPSAFDEAGVVIAGGGVRAVLELGGVRDVLTKSIGTQNPINLVKATMEGLYSLRKPEDVAKLRGISVREVLGVGDGATPETNGAVEEEKSEEPATPEAVVAEAPAQEGPPAEESSNG